MVLLSTFTIISGIGLALFIAGYFTEYPEISMIGAVFILGAGGMALEFGLEREAGHVEEVDDVGGQDEIHFVETTTEPIDTTSRLSLGFLTMLAGGAGILRSLNRFGEAG